ncbi:MAG: ABC transporter permease [Anaerolineales bacterium]|nr:ABC transporter permease [Anaerolineales bacterium]
MSDQKITSPGSDLGKVQGSGTPNLILDWAKRIFRARETGIAFVVLVIVVYLSLATDTFFTASNLAVVSRQIALSAIIAMGMTLVILTGGIDLSVGSVVAITSVMLGLTMVRWGMPIWISISIAILIGAMIGLINGTLLVKTKLPPFIVTLGMMGLARGAALVITKGTSISGFPAQYFPIGQGFVFDMIPIPVVIAVVLAIFVHIILSRTTFGRRIYLIGSNEEAALLSGISINRMKIWIYMICSALAAIEAVVETSRMATGQPASGSGYELTAIGAVVIGGASMNGGEGTVLGTLLGAILLGLITNGLILLGISAYWQQVFSGAIIILAVALDTWRRSQKNK